jgi:hypothetical protein
MRQVVTAEYDAKENLLRLAEPLKGMKHGQIIRKRLVSRSRALNPRIPSRVRSRGANASDGDVLA